MLNNYSKDKIILIETEVKKRDVVPEREDFLEDLQRKKRLK